MKDLLNIYDINNFGYLRNKNFSDFSEDDFANVFSDEEINKLISLSQIDNKYYLLLKKLPSYPKASEICSKSTLLEFYCNNYKDLLFMNNLSTLNEVFVHALLKHIANRKDKKDLLILIGTLNDSVLKEILNDELLSNLAQNNSDLTRLFTKSKISLINYILSTSYLKNKLSTYICKLDLFTLENRIENGLIIPNYITSSTTFKRRLLNIQNPKRFNYLIKILSRFHLELSEELKVSKDKIYNKEINNISIDGLLPIFKNMLLSEKKIGLTKDEINLYNQIDFDEIDLNKNRFYESIQEINKSFIKNILSYRYFRENYTNLVLDLEEILNFTITHPNLIDIKNINIYSTIVYFNDLSIIDKIDFYNSLNNKTDYEEMVYDDYLLCRNACYNEINQELFNPNENTELRGEDFTALVHINRWEKKIEHNEPTKWQTDNITVPCISFSIIDETCIKSLMCNPHDYVCYGFGYINPNLIMHICNSDSYSTIFGSLSQNKLENAKELIEDTINGYNEILCLNDPRKPIKPTYILAYDEISEYDIKASKCNNIPIVLIDSRMYKHKDVSPGLVKRYELNHIDSIKG